MRWDAPLPQHLPLFPLYGALLLPRMQLPLHIFEPRYLAMLNTVLARPERLIALVQPMQPAEGARLHQVGCVGRVTGFWERPDGRYDITLSGLSRFKLEHVLDADQPWKQAEVSYLGFEDDRSEMPQEDHKFDRSAFLALLYRFLQMHGLPADIGDLAQAPDEMLINTLAMLCPFAAEERQALLESSDLAHRRTTMTALLHYAVQKGPDDEEVVQ